MGVSLLSWAFLLIVVTLTSGANEEPGAKQVYCCYSFLARKIPLRIVNDYFRTSEQCLMPGIIFQTKKGKLVCTEPKEAWVKEYVQYLNMRRHRV